MGSIINGRGMLVPHDLSKLNTADVQNAYTYYTLTGVERPCKVECMILATRVATLFHPDKNLDFYNALISGSTVSQLPFRHMQFYNDVYGFALDGTVTHDLFVWEAMLSYTTATVAPDAYGKVRKSLTDRLARAKAMPLDKFIQQWMERSGGFDYTLELLRPLVK